MNRQAIVLAADSAVTYGGGPDPVVTLEAEKILQLSPTMAVMVYSRGDVLGRSWSHIAHAFSREMGDRVYESVTECASAFFSFIDNNRKLFPEVEERQELESLMKAAFLTVVNHARTMRQQAPQQYETDEAAFVNALDMYRAHLNQDENGTERASLEIYADLSRERFYQLYADLLDPLIQEALGAFGMTPEIRDRLYDFAYQIATKPAFLEPYAGLVFAGFGEGDVFPVYSHHYASIMVDGIIKRAHDETTHVGVEDGPNAYLRTFAQAEMTHAFLRGVHPFMFEMMSAMNMVTNEAAAEAALHAAGLDGDTRDAVMAHMRESALPRLGAEFIHAAQSMSQEEFINPFISVVAASGKKQLAETSKALVELNILKSDLHQAQTGVGGEVDVAMISRTGGFEWYAKKS